MSTPNATPKSSHGQEGTVLSMTDTVVEPSGRPSYRSDVTAVGSADSSQSHADTATDSELNLKDQRDARPSRTFVPPTNKHRCLILCFDGTGDQFDADNSNIVQLVSALKKDDREKQMVYYQSGIGTYTSSKIATPVLTKLSLTLDSMIAWNLDAHVTAGYEFLMQNYTANDRICIFGFSRGAYIARSLAGMLHKVGLLPVDNHQQVPFAFRMYARADATGWAQSNAFKRAFCTDVGIDFIGVWDTVDSVGLIPRRLPFTTSNTIVRTFRHAVSLDERRAKFKANLWNFPSDQEKKLGTHAPPTPPPTPPPKRGYTSPRPALRTHFKTSTTPDDNMEQTKFETEFSSHRRRTTRKTDVLEVWFAGCHCDVGGGSVQNDMQHSLARIPLRWMIRELGLDPAMLHPVVIKRPAPIEVDENALRLESIPKCKSWLRRLLSRERAPEFTMSPELAETSLPTPAPDMEELEDLQDAMCPIYDQLKLKPFWWLLEIIPMGFRSQQWDDQWVTKFRANLGRARVIPHQRPPEADPMHAHYDKQHPPVRNLYVHRTVEMRHKARDSKGRFYVNRARFTCLPVYVD
ncbi:hypothetical protein B0H17DRAFT_1030373 [Mycena rosella]|uniref:T6SS Phospholipase effector Tle1-like catalytic domain-containing protein n=1 Tax=Mycena rosella TaxID=1033263 RepID=A0AAD7GZJ1_MYCRO|nr:hypothetical protein B0H17DRAFT_1030373 [Mycena rosella]